MIIQLPLYRAVLRGGVSMGAMLTGGAPVWQPGEKPTVSGTIWVGYYDDTSIMATAALVQGADQIRLSATPVGGGSKITSATLTVDPTQRFAKTTLTGLAPGTSYLLAVESVDSAPVAVMPGSGRTRGARQAIAFGHASCGIATRDEAIYDTIVDSNPDFVAFYHLGDRGYPNIGTNNVALFHSNCDAILSLPRQSKLHRAVPVIYIWDDHDFGANDSTSSSASKPAALTYFRDRVPCPTRLSGALDPATYSHFPDDGIEVVMLDGRSQRNWSVPQIISPDDEAYLISRIQATGATDDGILLINAGVPWIAAAGTSDTWGAASAQRQRIVDAINQYAVGRVGILSGDMHALAFDDGRNSPGGLPVFHAAPLAQSTSSKGGPYQIGAVRTTQNQYGRSELTPVAGGWDWRCIGYSVDAAGVQTVAFDQTVTLKAPALEAPLFTGDSVITGGPYAGNLLTVDPGPYTGFPEPEVYYQWQVDSEDVLGAEGSTFARPAGTGKVPAVRLTLVNGVAPPDERLVMAAATLETPVVDPGGDTPDDLVNAQILALNPLFLMGGFEGNQWTDLSGNGRHGLVVGTQGTRVTEGPSGMPFFMGASDCHAEIAHDPAFNSEERCWLFWFNSVAAGGNVNGVYRSSNEKVSKAGANDKIQVYWNGQGSLHDSTGIIFNGGEWRFVAAMIKPSATAGVWDSQIYAGVNGVFSDQGAVTRTSLVSTIEKIGINARIVGATIDRRSDLGVSKLARFDRALTATEVEAIYNASLTTP